MSSVIRGSDNFDSAVKSGTIEATASGAIASGSAVLVNSDGTVSQIGEYVTSIADTFPVTSTRVSTSSQGNEKFIDADPHNAGRFAMVFRNVADTNKLYLSLFEVVAGKLTVTHNDSVAGIIPYTGNTSGMMAVKFDKVAENKIYIAFNDENGNNTHVIVGTISGTSVSYGSIYDSVERFENGTMDVDPHNEGRFIICGASGGCKVQAGQVTGTSVSFGSAVSGTGTNGEARCNFDPHNANYFAFTYSHADSTARICTLSGTSISLGSVYTLDGSDSYGCWCAYDQTTSGKILFSYSTSPYGYHYFKAANVSGTSLSIGSAVWWPSHQITDQYGSLTSNPFTAGEFLANFKQYAVVVTVSGTTVSIGSDITVASDTNRFKPMVFNPAQEGGLVYPYYNGDSPGLSVAVGQFATSSYTLTTADSEAYVGISSGTYSDGNTATITTLGGASDVHSGLTAGSKYYIQSDGTISDVVYASGYEAGLAVSTTDILVKG
jgi:hypothetical protein